MVNHLCAAQTVTNKINNTCNKYGIKKKKPITDDMKAK